MKIAIFSDLHLARHRPDEIRLFEDILSRLGEEHSEKGNELWLLGDIFDLMIGPFDGWLALYPGIFAALRRLLNSGWKILWIQGNHDFYLEKLLTNFGIEVSDSEIIRSIAGKKIYLAHGDLVNQEDEKYLKWRAWTRSEKFQRALRWLHKTAGVRGIEKIGLRLSKKSSRERAALVDRSERTREIFQEFARARWGQGFDLVVLGHSHIEEELCDGPREYLNLGSWVNYSPRYALWDTSQENFPKRLLS